MCQRLFWNNVGNGGRLRAGLPRSHANLVCQRNVIWWGVVLHCLACRLSETPLLRCLWSLSQTMSPPLVSWIITCRSLILTNIFPIFWPLVGDALHSLTRLFCCGSQNEEFTYMIEAQPSSFSFILALLSLLMFRTFLWHSQRKSFERAQTKISSCQVVIQGNIIHCPVFYEFFSIWRA